MRKWVLLVFALLLITVPPGGSIASTQSETLVQDGRALLSGSVCPDTPPTYSDIVAANQKFESAVADDPTDTTAQFFYAVTRIMVSPLVQGENPGIETVLELLEAFGKSRTTGDSLNEPLYTEHPQLYGYYTPPDTVPSGEELRSFMGDSFVALLDSSIANLNAISDPSFSVILSAQETGDLQVEIDYGDVLFLKALLYTVKASLQIITSYDMSVNLRETIILANTGLMEFQRDLLDKYSTLLSLRSSGGAAQLLLARASLMLAVDTLEDAFDFITSEVDSQDDDLFSFGEEEEIVDARFALNHLAEIQLSLTENRAITDVEESWLFTIEDGSQVILEINKNAYGTFLDGSFYRVYGWSLPEDGWVKSFSVNGSGVTVEIGFAGMCPGSAVLTGILINGSYISSGTYEALSCMGTTTGTFTASKEGEESQTTADLNYLFANSGKEPLDIRTTLPEFSSDGSIFSGTFPLPVLNNIFTQATTESELVNMFALEVVTPATGATVTGNVSCSAYDGNGTLYVIAAAGPDPDSDGILASTYLNGPGAYSLHDLPIGSNAYLFAWWDADDNGIQSYGDFLGSSDPVLVQPFGVSQDIILTSEIADSSMLTNPGVYKIYGSNSYVMPPFYYGPWDPNEISWDDDWNFIGEGSATQIFNADRYYKYILIIWHDDVIFHFDSFEDLTAGTALATNSSGQEESYSIISSGLKNYDADSWSEPWYLKGFADTLYVRTTEDCGFSLFTMPDDGAGLDTARQLKLTAISGTAGDVDGDGISDSTDNCLVVYNPLQTNSDIDSSGDICDFYGTISGTVTDEDSGQPLVGAVVTIFGAHTWFVEESDCAGEYVFRELAEDAYLIQVCAQGYACEYYENVFDWDSASFLSLARGEDAINVDFILGTDWDSDGLPDSVDTDDDNDGMPDAWEDTYGLNSLDDSDADLDGDGDGTTNLEEYLAGTNPQVDDSATAPNDFNIDGISDIVIRSGGTGLTWIYEMNSVPVVGSYRVATLDPAWWDIVGLKDFDGDRKADILVQKKSTKELWLYQMDGTVLVRNLITAALLDGEIVALEDFTGDGNTDILTHNTATGTVWLYEMNGYLMVDDYRVTSIGSDTEIAGFADFDDDGMTDILVRKVATNVLYLYKTGTAPLVTSYRITALPLNWQVVALDDFGGDGLIDILVRSADNGLIYLYSTNGTALGHVGLVSAPPLNWQIVGLGDFNGDRKADIYLRNSENGLTWLYEMNENVVEGNNRVCVVGLDSEIVGLHDYNGDAKTDVLTRKTTNGLTWLYEMNGSAITESNKVATITAEWEFF